MLKQATASGKGVSSLIKSEDRANLLYLQQIFWQFVDEAYEGQVRRQDLLNICASLLFSLIPLHRSVVQPLFFEMCVNLLEHETACPL